MTDVGPTTNEHRKRDHLTQLPAELLHVIFSFLLPTHIPDRAVFDSKKEKPCSHELDKVAATSKLLRSEVNEWALHFMIAHKTITKFEVPKSVTKRDRTANRLRGRKGLLTWCSTHCVFCGKKSARSAILVNGFRCCAACDKAQWYVSSRMIMTLIISSLFIFDPTCDFKLTPYREKITLTDAKRIYGLREENLLPNQHVNSETSRKLLAQLGVPQARYGVYTCQGARATMFLLEDVKQLAALVHGELESYMAKREAARVARNAKAENRKQDAAALKLKPSRPASSDAALPAGLVVEHDEDSSYVHLGDFLTNGEMDILENRQRELIAID